MQSALVFLLFALVNKPLPRLFAEVAQPDLKQWDFSQAVHYQRIWHEVSMVWVLGYLGKATVFIAFHPLNESDLAILTIILGWPLHVGLLMFSVPYVNFRFQKYI
ncbi:hypothetical protein [Vibrio sp. CAU 1672]|uniref:hypothetical protein n=1 Tax=Vibrio sp. CAU 1672 TaxID=3032594 RepID=UPI0023DC16B0|nr:hypothetical protein [Vibrio sp. CAU 1672]MDF2154572.1 hypothetical protein [Vibrio sp. CAU 1672]